MVVDIHPDALKTLISGDHGAPTEILGRHSTKKNVIIRTFRPWADKIRVVNDETGERILMKKVDDAGLFEANLERTWADLPYHFEAQTFDENTEIYGDPYNYEPMISDYDMYLFGEGRHLQIYDRLGAHIREIDGVKGVNFAVWAPNAYKVSVIGDFNRWDNRVHTMTFRPANGIWEVFIPNLEVGVSYKYDIRSHNQGYRAEKIDPYGFYFEKRPNTASIVYDLDQYEWQDTAWMEKRAQTNPLPQPMSTYEVHLGSWRRKENNDYYTYNELADELVPYLKDMGYTHVELLPISEHPVDVSWGYQVTGYYAPTSRFGTPDEFMHFVDVCHQNDIGVILDWVPAHFAVDGHALNYFDGTHLYRHEDPRKGEHPDWGTLIFNYGRNEVRNFLIANALFWLKKYHIDGLRVDTVTSMLYLDFSREDGQWIPNIHGGNENLEAVAFIKELNELVHAEAPGSMTIAEESTSWAMVTRPTYIGGLGFTFKWNMGWMHDTLEYMKKNPIYRRFHYHQITFVSLYAFSENFVLSLSHDEVVHGKGSIIGKMPGDYWQQFAQVRLLLGYQYSQVGKILNFMGAEIGQFAEWSEARSLDWHLLGFEKHKQLQDWVRDLNHFYKSQPALYQQDFDATGFQWLESSDTENSIYAFLRFASDPDDFLVIVLNFTPIVRDNYRVAVPKSGFYKELINSDSSIYGGSNVGNLGGVHSEEIAHNGLQHSVTLRLPPLGMLILKKE